MYHRFHAPYDCRVERVAHIPGDTWNVNPIALNRIEKLFCKNERAVIRALLPRSGAVITLVPVAAILVSGIRLRFLDLERSQSQLAAAVFDCQIAFKKGEEMRWFEHGSTILVFAPKGAALGDAVEAGATIRMGRPPMRLP
jgi:phosphatidylserine decarboxylase